MTNETARIDQALATHLMGLTYKSLTENDKPSAQLIAFVNYSEYLGHNLAVESFDSDIEHELILQAINQSNAFDFLKKTTLEAISGLGQPALEGFFGKLFQEKVVNYPAFLSSIKLHDIVSNWATNLIIRIPKSFDLNAWNKYREMFEESKSDLMQKVHQLINVRMQNGETDDERQFHKSGWTQEKYEYGRTLVESRIKAGEKTLADHRKSLDRVKQWAERADKNNPDHARILAIIHASLRQFWEVDNNLVSFAKKAVPVINNVERLLKKYGEE